jgi:hypothetical protein
VNGVWLLVVVLAFGGALLLVRALRDVREQIGATVDAFHDFRSALAPALVLLRDETRDVTVRLEPARDPYPKDPRRSR